MPELPDITVYLEAIAERTLGRELVKAQLGNPFLLRTVAPPLSAFCGRKVERVRRVGKRIAIGMEGDHWLSIHLMIAGRLHWKTKPVSLAVKTNLATFEFGGSGILLLTEAGSQRRAALHLFGNETELAGLDAGGIDVLSATVTQFDDALRAANHTLKRALTDPRILSGIGNAYSDEILHAARLSPVLLTQKMTAGQMEQLFDATRRVLAEWCDRLRAEAKGGFPEKVTAFREGMAAHGRYGLPCPACGSKIQRIRHAANETNYCPHCQTGGKLLADRALSRLLGADWPKTAEALEEMTAQKRPG